jgi:hypothetical protein
MDAIETVKTAFSGAHMWFNGTAGDITDEQANHIPPGRAQPIGELMAHILHCEDGMLSMFLLKQPTIWEREGWGAKTGLPLMIDMPPDPSRRRLVDAAALREYGQKAFAQTDAFLASLVPSNLDDEVDMTSAGLGKMSVGAFLLTMLLGNTYAHTGEISALKGLMGSKGYPF